MKTRSLFLALVAVALLMLMPSTAFAQQALLQAADSALSSEIGAAEANAPAISCSVKVGAAWQEAHIDGAYAQTDPGL